MKLLGIDDAGRRFLIDAACHAAHELGVFDALDDTPRSAAALGARVGAAPRRLAALLDVLAAVGAARRAPDGYTRRDQPPRPPPPPAAGWGLLAEVLRSDAPLPLDPSSGAAYYRHLDAAGRDAAAAVAARLPAGTLLDLGAGTGVYARAYLDRHPDARATLVDLAAPEAAPHPRAARLAGDLLTVDVAAHDVVLLANVLHLHDREACRAIVARAAALARALVAVVEVDVAADRAGPLDALLFALQLSVHASGALYDAGELAGLLDAAALGGVTQATLPDGMILVSAAKLG
jgi:20-O-methyltransferase